MQLPLSRCAVWPVLLIVLALTGCDQRSARNAGSKPPVSDPAARTANVQASDGDREVAKLLANKEETAEARAWLAADPSKHVLWKGDRKAITQLVDNLYKAGAKEIQAVGIVKENFGELVAMFAAVLPAEPAARAAVIKVHNSFWRSYLKDEDEDEIKDFLTQEHGQKYLLFNFDL